jgi:hypothetical protein
MPVVYPTTWIPCRAQDAAQKSTSLWVARLAPACLQLARFGWASYQVTCRDGETIFQIRVDNAPGVNQGVRQVALDGNTEGCRAF